ncbi:MAG: ATPase domain-containing protein, partial [Nitrospira sp.]
QRQILRNMSSIGLDLSRWVERGLLQFHAARPHLRGLEMHLAIIHKQIGAFQPTVVVIDPVSNLLDIGTAPETKAMLTRLIDFLKGHGITTVLTSLTSETDNPETTEVGISSLMDTWLLLRNLEHNGERTRGLFILKSRGMGHSHQIREFTLSDHGAELRDVYTGPAGVLTGTARTLQEARDRVEQDSRHNELSRKQRELESKRQTMEAQVASLRAAYDAEAFGLERVIDERSRAETVLDHQRRSLGVLRDGATGNGSGNARKGVGHGRLRQQSRAGKGRKEGPRGEAR